MSAEGDHMQEDEVQAIDEQPTVDAFPSGDIPETDMLVPLVGTRVHQVLTKAFHHNVTELYERTVLEIKDIQAEFDRVVVLIKEEENVCVEHRRELGKEVVAINNRIQGFLGKLPQQVFANESEQ